MEVFGIKDGTAGLIKRPDAIQLVTRLWRLFIKAGWNFLDLQIEVTF